MKYVNYNKNTDEILGYYDDSIHYKNTIKHIAEKETVIDENGNEKEVETTKEIAVTVPDIPEPNFEITEEQWVKAVNENATHVDLETKELIVKPYEISLDEIKELKLAELNTWFENAKNKSKINLKGFGIIDGGYKYLLNVNTLINTFNAETDKMFRMEDNSFKEVTLEKLQDIKTAIELAGKKLHHIKWQYEQDIQKAKKVETIKFIVFSDTIEIDLGAKK